jgi:hypothetical protein
LKTPASNNRGTWPQIHHHQKGGNGRTAGGRFAKGYKGGPGNPHARRVGQLQAVLLGAVKRAEAQVMRLGLVYAVLDRSPWIRYEHLRAALAIWDYVRASAKHVFGASLANPRADEIPDFRGDGQSASPQGLGRGRGD